MRRVILVVLALPVALVSAGCGQARHLVAPPGASGASPTTADPSAGTAPPAGAAEPGPPAVTPVDFEGEVRPILEARCQPCHFQGGKMYEQMPFDSPETIRDLGTRLFTRIRDPEEQAIIRAFLGPSAETGDDADTTDQPPR